MGGKGGDSQTIGYEYYLGMQLVLCTGKVDRFQLVRIGEKDIIGSLVPERLDQNLGDLGGLKEILYELGMRNQDWVEPPYNTDGVQNGELAGLPDFDIGCVMKYSYRNLFGGELGEGGVAGRFITYGGDAYQQPDDYLVSKIASEYPISATRGVTSVVMPRCYIGNTPYPKPIEFLVSRILRRTNYSAQWYPEKVVINGYDMNPIHIIHECLVDSEWGCGESGNDINYENFKSVADVLFDEGLGLSFLVNEDNKLEDFLSEVLEHIGGVLRIGRETGQYEIKLLRDDFDIDKIPHFNEDNILGVKNFKRPSLSELPNAVVVSFWDLALMEVSTYKAYDPAAIAIQGGEVTKDVNLTGVTNLRLAAQQAHRILGEQSTPLASMDVETDRSAVGMNVGDAIAISWSEFNLHKVPFRILEIKESQFGKGKITLKVFQDVFTYFNAEVDVDARDPLDYGDEMPQPITHKEVIELPYALAVRAVSSAILESEDMQYVGILATVGVKPQNLASGYIPTFDDGDVSGVHVGFAVSIVLSHDLGVINTDFSAAYYESEFPEPVYDLLDGGTVYNGAGYIGGEFVWVSYDTETGTGTLQRGGYDSTPRTHLSGERLYLLNHTEGVGLLRERFIQGEDVTVWFSTVSEGNVMFKALSPTVTVEVEARQYLPNPPRNVQLNGQVFNERVLYSPDGFEVDWVASDKMTEDHQFVTWYVEVGTKDDQATYTVELVDSNGTQIYFDDTLTTESVSLPNLTKGATYTLTVNTVLNEVESLTYEKTFKVKPYSPPLVNVRNAETRFNQTVLGNFTITDTQHFDPSKTSRALYLATNSGTQRAGYTLLDPESIWGEVLIFEFNGDVATNISPDKLVLCNTVGDHVIGFGLLEGEPCIELFLGSNNSKRIGAGVTLVEGSSYKYIFDPYKKSISFYCDGVLVSEVDVNNDLLSFAHRVKYGEEIDRLYYYTGTPTDASMYISQIRLTTYSESLTVDENADLFINGFAELGMVGWEPNPQKPYVVASQEYDGLSPTEGTYLFKFARESDNYTDIWFQQHVVEERIYTKYGLSLSQVASLGSYSIKVDWMQGRHSSRNYGVYVVVEQFDISGALVDTSTSTNYYTAAADVMEAKSYKVAIAVGAESFRVRFVGLHDYIYMYLGIDEVVGTLVDASDLPPPRPEDVAALNVFSYGSVSFHQAPDTDISSQGLFSWHIAPETVTANFGVVSFWDRIVQDTKIPTYGAVSFHEILPKGRLISGYGAVSFMSAPEPSLATYGTVSFMSAPDPLLANYGAVSFMSAPDPLLVNYGAVSFMTLLSFEAGEVLLDGSFESGGWLYWNTYDESDGVAISSSLHQLSEGVDGEHFLGVDASSDSRAIYQDLSLDGGHLASIEQGRVYMDFRMSVCNPKPNSYYSNPDYGQIIIEFYDELGRVFNTVRSAKVNGLYNNKSWQSLDFSNVYIPKEARKVRFVLQHHKNNTTAYFAADDCSAQIREVANPPIDLVKNGNFENQGQDWSLGQNGGAFYSTTDDGVLPVSGMYMFGIDGDFTSDAVLTQTLDPSALGLSWQEICDNYRLEAYISTVSRDAALNSRDKVDVTFTLTLESGEVVEYVTTGLSTSTPWVRHNLNVEGVADHFDIVSVSIQVKVKRNSTYARGAVDAVQVLLFEREDVTDTTYVSGINQVTFMKAVGGKEYGVSNVNQVTFMKVNLDKEYGVSNVNQVTFIKTDKEFGVSNVNQVTFIKDIGV